MHVTKMNCEVKLIFLFLLIIYQIPSVLTKKTPDIFSTAQCNQTYLLGEKKVPWEFFRLPTLTPPFLCYWTFETKPANPIQLEIRQLENLGFWDEKKKQCKGGFVQISGSFYFKDPEEKTNVSTKLCSRKVLVNKKSKQNQTQNGIPMPFYAENGVINLQVLVTQNFIIRPQLSVITTVAIPELPLVDWPPSLKSSNSTNSSTSAIDCNVLHTTCGLEECIITSKNYPGIQFDNRACRHIFRANSKKDRIRMTFEMAMDISNPIECDDYISISSPVNLPQLKGNQLLIQICNESSTVEVLATSDVIVQYKTSQEKPFTSGIKSGHFIGRVRFIHVETDRDKVSGKGYRPPDGEDSWTAVYREKTAQDIFVYPQTGTDYKKNGFSATRARLSSTILCPHKIDPVWTGTREGNFRFLMTGKLAPEPDIEELPPSCSLRFTGTSNDFIYVNVKESAPKLSKPKCDSNVKITEKRQKEQKQVSNLCNSKSMSFSGKIVTFEHQTESNTSSQIMDFIEGNFSFYRLKTDGFIDKDEPGEIILKDDEVVSSGEIPFHSKITSVVLHPGNKRMVSLIFNRQPSFSEYKELRPGPNYCQTVCGSSSCQCKVHFYQTSKSASDSDSTFTVSDLDFYTRLSNFDHITVQIGQKNISCFCGLAMETPYKIFADGPLKLNYHVTSDTSEMTYKADYEFMNKNICPRFPGPKMKTGNSILAELGPIWPSNTNILSFCCRWEMDIAQTQAMTLTIKKTSRDKNTPCSTWNISVVPEKWSKNHLLPETMFCPMDKTKVIKFPVAARKGRMILSGLVTQGPKIKVNWTFSERNTEDERVFDWRTNPLAFLGIVFSSTMAVSCLYCLALRISCRCLRKCCCGKNADDHDNDDLAPIHPQSAFALRPPQFENYEVRREYLF